MQQGVRGMQGKAARHARQSSKACEECKAEIPNPNKKADGKLPKLTIG